MADTDKNTRLLELLDSLPTQKSSVRPKTADFSPPKYSEKESRDGSKSGLHISVS